MANEYLKRTPSSAGNTKVFTISLWIKDTDDGTIMCNADTSANHGFYFAIATNEIYCGTWTTSWQWQVRASRKVRDSSNWMHVIIAVDTSHPNPEKRVIIYINGSEQTTTEPNGYPSLNYDTLVNKIKLNAIGRWGSYGGGYLASNLSDYYFIDGQALTSDVFGFYKDGDGYVSVGSTYSTEFKPGQWVPHSPRKIKSDIERRGGFGVNGFYLPMNDSSNPGADFHCTPNTIITLKGEDLPQPRNGAPTTSDAYVSQLREETGTLGFDGAVKFDGSTQNRLTLPVSSDFAFGTGDLTVEMFVYHTDLTGQQTYLGDTYASTAGLYLYKTSTNQISVYDTAQRAVSVANVIKKGQWQHLAWTVSSGVLRQFVDGYKITETSYNGNYTVTEYFLGDTAGTSSGEFIGFMSNVRIIKGTALYTANFTPPTEPLTNVTNTKLLCCNSSTSATAATVTPGTITKTSDVFATRNELSGSIVIAVPGISGGQGSGYGDYSADIRGSGSNKTTTSSGNVAITTLSSYYGSGMRLSGSGNSSSDGGLVSAASNTDFNLALNDFTLEGWIYAHANTQDSGVFGVGSGGAEPFLTWTNGTLKFRGNGGGTLITSPVTIAIEQWHHVALESYNAVLSLIINGVVVGTATNTHTFSAGGFLIGSWTDGRQYGFDGDIQDVRLYKGVAKYKGGFNVSKPYAPIGIESFRTLADCTTNNFATFNPLTNSHSNGHTISEGNLRITNSNYWRCLLGTHGVSSGKWYYEIKKVNDAQYMYVGWGNSNTDTDNYPSADSNAWAMRTDIATAYHDQTGTISQVAMSPNFNQNDICGCAIDVDNGRVWWSRNGVWLTADGSNDGNPATGSKAVFSNLPANTYHPVAGVYNETAIANFGQNPSFSGTVTAGTNADSNGKGLFKYAPPSGYLALCEDNLPAPVIADPGDYFKTVLWAGDGNNGRGITGVGFKPDLVWLKSRTNGGSHRWTDVVRGVNKQLMSNTTEVEATFTTMLTSFDSDGFTLGDNVGINGSGYTNVAWCWKAGGDAVSNTDGTITSQVSANQDAGFSIVSFTSPAGGAQATVGHGLNKAPNFIIAKSREDSSYNWAVFHSSVCDSTSKFLRLNTTDAIITYSTVWGASLPTSSVFGVTSTGVVPSSDASIAYCWTEVEGFSKFGSYTGNGSNNGTFVYCGFKPAWVMVKVTSGTSNNWYIHDSSRDSTNPANEYLMANQSNIATAAAQPLDMLSNGFKLRNGSFDGYNGSGYTYVFMAFAESPFKTANAK